MHMKITVQSPKESYLIWCAISFWLVYDDDGGEAFIAFYASWYNAIE